VGDTSKEKRKCAKTRFERAVGHAVESRSSTSSAMHGLSPFHSTVYFVPLTLQPPKGTEAEHLLLLRLFALDK